MTVQPFDDIPEAVWRAREAEDAYREQAEKDWDKRRESRKRTWTLTQWEELELHAVVKTGLANRCPKCDRAAYRMNNIWACVPCHVGWDADDE